ncbi:MAG: glutamate racemase [Bacteroidota bacterium]
MAGPIGIFDSGYGGLTVYRSIQELLPEYDYLYLGDNARTPYGNRSFETVYRYTWECVRALFSRGCRLVILACNTASAKALRSIQQRDLPPLEDRHRVLGVIRPTTELIGEYTASQQIGILATEGTVASRSYPIEIERFFPQVQVIQEACPMWVPLVENREHQSAGADYFVQQHLDRILSRGPRIDTLLLACTHYPLLHDKIRHWTPDGIKILTQGKIVAHSLRDYLRRHPDIEAWCSKGGQQAFWTTESPAVFDPRASFFLGNRVAAQQWDQ